MTGDPFFLFGKEKRLDGGQVGCQVFFLRIRILEANTERVSFRLQRFLGVRRASREGDTNCPHFGADVAGFPDQDPHQTAAREACEEVTAQGTSHFMAWCLALEALGMLGNQQEILASIEGQAGQGGCTSCGDSMSPIRRVLMPKCSCFCIRHSSCASLRRLRRLGTHMSAEAEHWRSAGCSACGSDWTS